MLNLSEVIAFYESQTVGKCNFVAKSGSHMGMTCPNKTNSLFCEKHEDLGVDKNKAIEFLQQLVKNPEKLNEILEDSLFLSVNHLDENCEDEGCDNCYNEDAEFEYKDSIFDSIMSIVENLPSIPTSNLPSIPTSNLPSLPKTNLPSLPTSNLPSLPTSNLPQLELQVTVYQGNLFREVSSGYILKQNLNGDVQLEVDETEKHLKRKMTERDFTVIRSMGIEL